VDAGGYAPVDDGSSDAIVLVENPRFRHAVIFLAREPP
jgi:hypothetical protein